MKTMSLGMSGFITGCLIFSSIFILPAKVKSQDTVTQKPGKVVTLKFDIDGEEGRITVDTTFLIDTDLGKENLEKYLAQINEQMQDVEKDMAERARDVYRDGRKAGKCKSPGLYYYNGYSTPGYRVRDISSGTRGETLSDVLGDIPMKAVLKYDVKKTKNGRKYIIEVDDDFRGR